MAGDECVAAMPRESRPLRCRLGLHKWSDNRGGIQICRRSGCHDARTYGLTGTMRLMQWKESLYEEYKRFEEGDE